MIALIFSFSWHVDLRQRAFQLFGKFPLAFAALILWERSEAHGTEMIPLAFLMLLVLIVGGLRRFYP